MNKTKKYKGKSSELIIALFIIIKKLGIVARCRWLIPIILATWEAEIKRIVV
jgi:hypothetical protein